jgi:hypothetical protein
MVAGRQLGGTVPSSAAAKGGVMHVIMRSYSDPDLAEMLVSNRDEVEALITGVPGVQSYYLVRTAEGCTSITVGEDESSTAASTEAAAGFLRDKGASAPPPTIASGDVLIHFGSGITAQ